MKYPTIRFIFNRRGTASGTQTASVELEVFFEKRQKRFSTGVRLNAGQWDPVLKVINRPDAQMLNLRLDSFYKGVNDYISALMISGEAFTFEGLTAKLNEQEFDGSFVNFVETRISERKDIAESTKKNHRKLVTALRSFGKIVLFSQVTRRNILEFDQWLHTRDYVQVTIHSYHKFMKIYIHDAMLRGLIEKYPYDGVKIEQGHSQVRKYLTPEKIEKIAGCSCLTPSLEKVRDLFMFQYYTGLAYSDMERFDFSKAVERNGRFVLHERRKKSGEDFYIVLVEGAMRILRKYDFKLPVMTNEQYNMRLKAVASCAGVEKRVTSHMARHSFAVNALNSGIPVEVVSKMLGHSNINTTQIYAKVMNRTVESAFDLLEKRGAK